MAINRRGHGVPFSDAEVAALERARAGEVSLSVLAQQMGRDVRTLRNKLHRMEYIPPKPKTTLRRCIGVSYPDGYRQQCREMIRSEGPHHRLCHWWRHA